MRLLQILRWPGSIRNERIRLCTDLPSLLRLALGPPANVSFSLSLRARLRHPPSCIGRVAISLHVERMGEAEVGMELDPPWRGRGWGTEVLALTETFLRRVFHTTRITARVRPENAAARALCRKAGYRMEGRDPSGLLRYVKEMHTCAGRCSEPEQAAPKREQRSGEKFNGSTYNDHAS